MSALFSEDELTEVQPASPTRMASRNRCDFIRGHIFIGNHPAASQGLPEYGQVTASAAEDNPIPRSILASHRRSQKYFFPPACTKKSCGSSASASTRSCLPANKR